jgi:hypothetical protein
MGLLYREFEVEALHPSGGASIFDNQLHTDTLEVDPKKLLNLIMLASKGCFQSTWGAGAPHSDWRSHCPFSPKKGDAER